MIQHLETQERHETDFGVYADAANVRLLPRIDTLADFYTVHDAIILPSRDHDPFGLTAAEAMLMGTPVLITDACGIASYLTDGKDAIIVKANSVVALQEGINRLNDAAMREAIGKEGKKTASELFTVEKMVEAYERLVGKRESGNGRRVGLFLFDCGYKTTYKKPFVRFPFPFSRNIHWTLLPDTREDSLHSLTFAYTPEEPSGYPRFRFPVFACVLFASPPSLCPFLLRTLLERLNSKLVHSRNRSML
jgi:hypothetical protein